MLVPSQEAPPQSLIEEFIFLKPRVAWDFVEPEIQDIGDPVI
jgi:hypothetical protein